MKVLSTLTNFLHQTAPFASVEQRPEIYEAGNRVEVVVPSDWSASYRLTSPSRVALRGRDGCDRFVDLPAAVSSDGAAIETHGSLTLLGLTRAAASAPVMVPSNRHVGHSRTVGAY